MARKKAQPQDPETVAVELIPDAPFYDGDDPANFVTDEEIAALEAEADGDFPEIPEPEPVDDDDPEVEEPEAEGDAPASAKDHQHYRAELLPPEPMALQEIVLGLDQLPSDEDLMGPAPTAVFRRSIECDGILTPIMVAMVLDMEKGGTSFRVIDGRNRIKAARAVGMTDIRAFLVPEGWQRPEGLTVKMNALRRWNPASDLEACETLIAAGFTESEIAANLGLQVQQVRKLRRLTNLPAELRRAFEAGILTLGNATTVSCMTPEKQTECIDLYREKGALSEFDIKRIKMVETEEVVGSMDWGALAPQAPQSVDAAIPVTTNGHYEIEGEVAPMVPAEPVNWIDGVRTLLDRIEALIPEGQTTVRKRLSSLRSSIPASE